MLLCKLCLSTSPILCFVCVGACRPIIASSIMKISKCLTLFSMCAKPCLVSLVVEITKTVKTVQQYSLDRLPERGVKCLADVSGSVRTNKWEILAKCLTKEIFPLLEVFLLSART